ncbi:alginate lyase family protein [Halosimplex amylolyticum]|uniref:alginate lyase family protein n=1 Tax=Halosimplex amylolyticum TaxID=3396616 RepID=UPI003F54EBA9
MPDDGDGRTDRRFSRRDLLAATGVAAASLSGCLDLLSSTRGETPSPRANDGTDAPTASPPAPPTATRSPTAGPGSPTSTRTPTPTPTSTAEPPTENYVYVSERQLREVADRVSDGESPWKPAYDKAIWDADKALNMSPKSVVDDGAPQWDDPHRFGATDDRHDYSVAIDMTTAVRDTALAYWFTDDDEYAERSIDLLYHWCLDPETKMKPDGDMANNGTEVELMITIPKLWYGASLLRGHPYWTEKTDRDLESAFESWVDSFVGSLADPGFYQYNNQWAWRIATIAGAASYLGDEERLEHAFCMWRGQCETAAHGKDKPRPWNQYRKDDDAKGYLKRELARHDGLNYHMYGMKALTLTAEIGRHHGVDLYGYNAPTDPGDGPTLKKLFDFMVPYLQSPSKWEWGTGSDGVDSFEIGNYASLFELAYSRWEDPAYLDVVRSLERPAYDFWILGWTTLTHGNWFDLVEASATDAD